MTKTRRRRLLLIGGLFAGLAAAVALSLSAFSQNLMYFHQPSQIVAHQVPINTRFRLGGLVQRGSIVHGKGLAVRFAVADCDANVPVLFTGALPDLFRAGQGVIAYGKLNAKGQFIADRVLAKHDANYMSPAVAKEMKTKQNKSCMPAHLQASR